MNFTYIFSLFYVATFLNAFVANIMLPLDRAHLKCIQSLYTLLIIFTLFLMTKSS